MKLNRKIDQTELELINCERNLKFYVEEYKAAQIVPLRDKSSRLQDLEYQITIYWQHLKKLRTELIGMYISARNASTA